MIFRQLFEPVSSTYTYLLGCGETGLAVLIDPVFETLERDLGVLQSLQLKLAWTIETHVHADHITAAAQLKRRSESRIAAPAMDRLPCAELGVEEGKPMQVGSLILEPLYTPGHTTTHHSYRVAERDTTRVFTGDSLFIDGCGRTDFQGGDAATLYRSIHDKIFPLPGDTLVYPGHDYQHRHVSTVSQERERNARLGRGTPLQQFVEIMNNLKLPLPKKIECAVPVNLVCGECPPELPNRLRSLCDVCVQG